MLSASDGFESLRAAANDRSRIAGLTHRFYRYPARFSPSFAAKAILEFSKPGDLVLDPYLGGGTSLVESLRLGRRAVGSDVNSLSIFLAKAKTTALTWSERGAIKDWTTEVVPTLLYSHSVRNLQDIYCEHRTKNLNLPFARPLKKVMALALASLDNSLPTRDSRNFARCALLNVGQWALNGKKRHASAAEFRAKLVASIQEMLGGLEEFEKCVNQHPSQHRKRFLIHDSAEHLPQHEPFLSEKASCAIASPPYPGIHMLYHRWQVDGRRESPAPYWLANCSDGEGATFYNFADRREQALDNYFAASLRTLQSIRKVLKQDAAFVQMVAFSDPATQLPRYLENMKIAGFEEELPTGQTRIQRNVPSRQWHATMKGGINAAREIVLIHRAS